MVTNAEVITGRCDNAPSTTVHDIANLLVAKRIGAVPVNSEDNDVVGIVTESDLLHREEIHTEHNRK